MPNPCEMIEEQATGTDTPRVKLRVFYTERANAFDANGAVYMAFEDTYATASDAATTQSHFPVTESASAADAALPSATRILGASTSAVASDEVSFRVGAVDIELATATDVVTYKARTPITESATASDSATPHRRVVMHVVETASSRDGSGRAIMASIVESGTGADGSTARIRAITIESATANAAAAPSARVTRTVTELAVAFTSTTSSLTTTMRVIEAATARDRDLLADPTAPSYWSNSETLAAATWHATPFNSFAVRKGQLLAAGATGIVAFTGDTDAGANIAAEVSSGRLSFGSNQIKQPDAMYASGTLAAPVVISVQTEDGSWDYPTHIASSVYDTVHRADFGRGLRATYARMTLRNTNGAAFDLGSFEITYRETHRKVY